MGLVSLRATDLDRVLARSRQVIKITEHDLIRSLLMRLKILAIKVEA
jgi:hypothetical protein